MLLSSLLFWTDSLEWRRRNLQPRLSLNGVRNLGEGSAQRKLQAGSSVLDYCVSVFSFGDDCSDSFMMRGH